VTYSSSLCNFPLGPETLHSRIPREHVKAPRSNHRKCRPTAQHGADQNQLGGRAQDRQPAESAYSVPTCPNEGAFRGCLTLILHVKYILAPSRHPLHGGYAPSKTPFSQRAALQRWCAPATLCGVLDPPIRVRQT
jgi:hypothetical protein